MNTKYNGVILCGGYGSRLLSYTKKTPKPLLTVSGKPFLYYIVKNLQRFGIKNILLLTHYKSDLFYKFKKKYFPLSSIRIVNEKKKLGTGGSLKAAKKYLDNFFFLFNGDTYFDFNLLDLKLSKDKKKLINVACTYKKKSSYNLILSKKNDIEFSKKNKKKNNNKLVFGGVYFIKKTVLNKINTKIFDLDNDLIFPLIKKKKISIKIYKNLFFDIGDSVKSYHQSHKKINQVLLKACCFLDRDGTINFDTGYIYKIKDFRWKRDCIKTIKFLNDNNYYVIVITNQAGVAHGYFNEQDVKNLHEFMNKDIFEKGAHIDKFYYCPYHESAKILKYKKKSNLRKPGNGMLLMALKEFKIIKKKSFFIGDANIDKLCAESTNIKFKYAKGNISNIVKNFINEKY